MRSNCSRFLSWPTQNILYLHCFKRSHDLVAKGQITSKRKSSRKSFGESQRPSFEESYYQLWRHGFDQLNTRQGIWREVWETLGCFFALMLPMYAIVCQIEVDKRINEVPTQLGEAMASGISTPSNHDRSADLPETSDFAWYTDESAFTDALPPTTARVGSPFNL